MASLHVSPDDTTVEVTPKQTILDATLGAGIPHTHACGGNARCSTCRVIVLDGVEQCGPRNRREMKVAGELDFGPDLRLACQTKLAGDVRVRRLVIDPEDVALTDLRNRGRDNPVGHEQDIAVLFSDIRSFTPLAESLMPYDVIHLLNRHFHEVTAVIEANGGMVCTYMGDGLMALFRDEDEAPIQAVKAGLGMLEAVDARRQYYEELYGKSYEIGIGIHWGQAVVGTLVGTAGVTAIGDAVNLASRIESANKEAGTRMLISDHTREAVGHLVELGRQVDLELKGKTGTHTLHEVTGLA